MVMFSGDSNEASGGEDRDVDRLVVNAHSSSVTKERLTQLDTTGIISRGIKLSDKPLIEYLEDNEKPHYILFRNGASLTLQAPQADVMLEKAGGWPSITILLTNKNIIIIQSKDRDLCVRIPLDLVTDCEAQADSREAVVEVDNAEIVKNLFNKFNQSEKIDMEVNKIKINLNNANDVRDIRGFSKYINEVGTQSPDTSSLAPDLGSYISQLIDILHNEEAQYIDIRIIGLPSYCYRITPKGHVIAKLSNDEYKSVEKFLQKENLSIIESEKEGNANGYISFTVSRGQSSKVAEKLLKNIHNVDDENGIIPDINGVSEEKVKNLLSAETESQSSEESTDKIEDISVGVSVHSGSELSGWLWNIDGTVASEQEHTKHHKLLGDSYLEYIYEFTNIKQIWEDDDGVIIDGEQLNYTDILNVRFLEDRLLNAGSSISVLHDCDYIALTVAKNGKPADEVATDYEGEVYHLYLIGPQGSLELLRRSNAESRMRNAPSASRSELKELSDKIRDRISSTPSKVYVLEDYIERPAQLKIEGWQESGANRINADISGDMESQGKSRGIQVGPYASSKSKSEGSIVAELDGDISDDSFSSEIKFLQVTESEIFIDSDPVLNLSYDAIDKVLRRDKGFTIEADGTAYTIVGSKAANNLDRTSFTALESPDLEEAIAFMQEQVSQSRNNKESSEENDNVAVDKLRELKELQEDGILTDEEFQSKKEELLDDL